MATEIASAYIKLIPSTDGIKQSLTKELGASGEAAGEAASKSIGSKLGGVMKTVGAAAAAAVTAAAAGFAALGKESLDYYADYEQLTGGIETLFGTGGATLEEYAAAAGKSVAEVSGDYSSLMTAQDAVFANAANAYKTAGLSANEYMETATSFAASLVSGLGGDTEEAARLADVAITDMADNANKMGTDISSIQNAYQGFAKQNYTMLDNLKLGYGGTQAEMARLINDSGVLGDSIEVTADTVNSVSFDKMIEAIHTVQDNMGITGTTAKEASETIQGSVASMKASWANFLTGMADENQNTALLTDQLVESIKTVAENIVPRLNVILPTLANGLTQLVTELTPYVGEVVQQLLPAVIDGAVGLVNGLVGALPGIISVLIEVLPTVLESLLSMISTQLPVLITSLINSLTAALPTLMSALVNGVIELATALTSPEVYVSFVEAGWNLVLTLVQGIVDALPDLIAAVPVIISNFVASIGEELPIIIQTATEIVMALIEGLICAIPALIAAIPELIVSIVDTFMNYDWGSLGTSIVDGIKNGFVRMWENFKTAVSNMVKSLVGSVKALLGIASPSKVFASIGGYMAEGMEEGLLGGTAGVQRAVQLMTSGTVAEAQQLTGIAAGSAGGYTPVSYTASGGGLKTLEQIAAAVNALSGKMESLQVVLDDGTLVGVMAPGMDRALGRRTTAAARGY